MSWSPRYPELAASLWRHLRAPEPADVLERAEEVHPGVHCFELVPAELCAKLCEELEAYQSWQAGQPADEQAPNSMHRYGVTVEQLGYAPAASELLARLVRPLAAHLYPELFETPDAAELAEVYGFAVAYGPLHDRALGFHVDDSDVTLNLCLGERFEGSELYFLGRRCARHRQSPEHAGEDVDLVHRPGWAVLHAGAHRHGVYPIVRGLRRNLLLWCQTPRDRQDASAPCPAWCGA